MRLPVVVSWTVAPATVPDAPVSVPNVIAGALVYPVPGLVMTMEFTTPFKIVVVAVAPTPPPPEIVTEGAAE